MLLLWQHRKALLLLAAAVLAVAIFGPMMLLATLTESNANMATQYAAVSTSGDLPSTCVVPTGQVTDAGKVPGLSSDPATRAEQVKVATAIIATAKGLHVSPQGQTVAIATALVESELQNLDHGLDTSLGAFQQLDDWGPAADRMDAAKAARMFFTGGKGGQAGLLDVPGWEKLGIGQAAQSVQASAFPDKYEKRAAQAAGIVTALTGVSAGVCAPVGGGLDCPPSGLAMEHGLTPDAVIVARCVHQQQPDMTLLGIGDRPAAYGDDHATGRAVDVMLPADYRSPAAILLGQKVADWAIKNAPAIGLHYVIFRQHIWNVERAAEGWRPMADRGSDNENHMTHVHVSVYGNKAQANTGTGGGSWTLPLARGSYTVSSGYGMRTNPVTGVYVLHAGLDFAAPVGTQIVAAESGTVTAAGPSGSAGNMTVIRGADGIVTRYMHQSRIDVTPGDQVKAGQPIGLTGNTGNSTGPHLHFEVRPGDVPTDPAPFLRAHGLTP